MFNIYINNFYSQEAKQAMPTNFLQPDPNIKLFSRRYNRYRQTGGAEVTLAIYFQVDSQNFTAPSVKLQAKISFTLNFSPYIEFNPLFPNLLSSKSRIIQSICKNSMEKLERQLFHTI